MNIIRKIFKKIIAFGVVLTLISGCHNDLSNIEKEILNYVSSDPDFLIRIKSYAYEVSGIEFDVENVYYPRSKTYNTDYIIIKLASIVNEELKLELKIDVKSEDSKENLISGKPIKFDIRYFDSLDKLHKGVLETVFESVLTSDYSLIFANRKSYIEFDDEIISSSLETSNLSDNSHFQEILDTFNKGQDFLSSLDKISKQTLLNNIMSMVKVDPTIVGGQTIQNQSNVYIWLIISESSSKPQEVMNEIENILTDNIEAFVEGLNHTVIVNWEGKAEVKQQRLEFKVIDDRIVFDSQD